MRNKLTSIFSINFLLKLIDRLEQNTGRLASKLEEINNKMEEK